MNEPCLLARSRDENIGDVLRATSANRNCRPLPIDTNKALIGVDLNGRGCPRVGGEACAKEGSEDGEKQRQIEV